MRLESNIKPKSKLAPNFDIELANIDDDAGPTVDLHDHYSDNDNLPEPSEMLKPSKWTTSSETSYPHSDIDILIRDIPMEGCKGPLVPQSAQEVSLDVYTIDLEDGPPLPSTPPPHLKRGRGTPDSQQTIETSRS